MKKSKRNRQAEALTPSTQLLDETPEKTAWGLEYIPSEGWVTITYKIKGRAVLSAEATPPDLRLDNFNKFKRAIMKWRMIHE